MLKNKLKKNKFTLVKERYIPVDINLEKNIFSKPGLKIFCAITGSKVREQTNFGIFRNRVLVFKIKTKLQDGDKYKTWHVRRYENDFYLLRSILSLSFG